MDTPTITEEAHKVGAERCRILKAARPLLALPTAQRPPVNQIAARCGTTASQICKLTAKFAHLKDEELTPENLAAKFTNAGRRSSWDDVAAQPEVRQRLQQLYLATTGASSDYMTSGRRTGSLALTLESFAHDSLCPDHLRPDLLAGKQPAPLKRIVREITSEIEQRYRGTRHMELHGSYRSTREMIEITEHGEEHDIQPGDWWVFDDMSSNLPHWFVGPDGEPMVGRQGLYAYDITGKWIGLEKVGTARDSYTAAIILRFIRRLMLAFGKPRRGIIFEQSVWKSRVIAGVRVTTKGEMVEDDFDRPEMSDEDKALIQQGLEALGIKIHYTHTPRGKEIESAFNYLQRVLGVMAHQRYLTTGRWIVNIGRHRGEFENAAKQMRRAHAGSHHPKDVGVLDIDEAADLEESAMQRIDARTKGRPESAQAAHDRSLRENALLRLTERDLAVFLPKAHELEIRGGKVVATVEGEAYEFSNGEVFASLGAAYRLYVRFDPSEPTLGAAIYNRETSSANHKGWQDGQFIGWADYVLPVARFDWRDQPEGDTQRKRFNKFVRTAFRAVGMPQFKAATARNGLGKVAEVTGARTENLPQRTGSEGATPKRRTQSKTLPAPTRTEVKSRREHLRQSAALANATINQ